MRNRNRLLFCALLFTAYSVHGCKPAGTSTLRSVDSPEPTDTTYPTYIEYPTLAQRPDGSTYVSSGSMQASYYVKNGATYFPVMTYSAQRNADHVTYFQDGITYQKVKNQEYPYTTFLLKNGTYYPTMTYQR
jgi:hypothetical protein